MLLVDAEFLEEHNNSTIWNHKKFELHRLLGKAGGRRKNCLKKELDQAQVGLEGLKKNTAEQALPSTSSPKNMLVVNEL